MIALLEYLTVILESVDLILVGKVFLSPTLKTPLQLIFTIKKAVWDSYAMISVPLITYALICLNKLLALIVCPKI